MTYHIFLGYDEREHEAYLVAKYSLESNTKSVPIKVHKLHHKPLRDKGLLTRGAFMDGTTGQMFDDVDKRPFSTQFTFSRFLIKELWDELEDENKSPYVMFADCDFLFLEDIGEMFEEIEKDNGNSPVYCVKHNYNPQNTVKMDGVEQSNYNMKLWAAMMVINVEHPTNNKLTPELVNTAKGRDLMNFCWIDDKDSIYGLSEGWQYIPNHSEDNTDEMNIVHWTEGGPYFKNYRFDNGYTDMWFMYFNAMLLHNLNKGQKGLEDIIDG